MLIDGEYIKRVSELAEEEMDAVLTALRTSLGTDAAGMGSPSAEEFAAFVFKQQAMYPPQLFVYPDGHTVFASPWLLALEFTTNGAEWVNRFTRVTEKAGF